jgi:hypothetical protein
VLGRGVVLDFQTQNGSHLPLKESSCACRLDGPLMSEGRLGRMVFMVTGSTKEDSFISQEVGFPKSSGSACPRTRSQHGGAAVPDPRGSDESRDLKIKNEMESSCRGFSLIPQETRRAKHSSTLGGICLPAQGTSPYSNPGTWKI